LDAKEQSMVRAIRLGLKMVTVRQFGVWLWLCCLGLGSVAITVLAAPQALMEYTSSSE
jgi:hypothetical protein